MNRLHGDAEGQEHANRLAQETSPYLLQHAHNPVDWYPWGEEAFAKAVAEDKPILLSVGYSACHWCHRLREESFENEDTARLLNQDFVCVKVDREERPDVDALYMDAVVALTGNGGWPMTVFLTPDGAPFYGGTYFPPRDRYGMPGFPRLLTSIATLWRTRREEVERQAEEFRQFYRRQDAARIVRPTGLDASADVVAPALLEEASANLLAQLDPAEGGFGTAPKFPHAMALEFLLRMEARAPRRGDDASRDEDNDAGQRLRLVRLTLDKMADGGIYDQIGGGFHRYATDGHWLVPHFEKMLYDNALLAPVYLHAWQLTGDARYRRICEETLDYVLREMTNPLGGFYSTQDADSEGEEGRFYVWTPAELRAALGEDDARVAELAWGVSARGNFEGRSILHVARPAAEVATALGLTQDRVEAALAAARAKLYETRARRVWPARDDKVLTAWNGFMQRALAEAGRVLDRAEYRQAAAANAAFLLEHLVADGRLLRSWRVGRAKLDAYLEDYGSLAGALLTTYEATGEPRWFAAARRITDELLERFWDEEAGTFFDTAHDAAALIGRPRELTDNATPSGTSLATETLLRLAAYTGESNYREVAARVLAPLAPAMARQPTAFGHLLGALDDLVGPLYEVAIVGRQDDAGRATLERTLSARYLPRTVQAIGEPDEAQTAAVPLLADRGTVEGHATAYVCQGFVCKRPVTRPEELAALLDG